MSNITVDGLHVTYYHELEYVKFKHAEVLNFADRLRRDSSFRGLMTKEDMQKMIECIMPKCQGIKDTLRLHFDSSTRFSIRISNIVLLEVSY